MQRDDAGVTSDDFCYLTTTGRRTGRPHRIEIWYAGRRPRSTSCPEAATNSHWVQNLMADPAVTVELDGQTHPARARVLDGDEAEQARTLVFAKYHGRYEGDLEEWHERALPVVLDLTE